MSTGSFGRSSWATGFIFAASVVVFGQLHSQESDVPAAGPGTSGAGGSPGTAEAGGRPTRGGAENAGTAQASVSDSASALTEAVATGLLRQSPFFTGANGVRQFSRLARIQYQVDAHGGVWFVEFAWQEGGRARSGVAVFARPQGRQLRWFFQQGEWAIAAVAEDRTLEQALAELREAPIKAREAAALGDIRTLISAHMAYQSLNQGAYGELACLAEPASCLPGYGGSALLDKEIAGLQEKLGYRRKFHPGPPAKGRPRSLTAWAYSATPAVPGKTGRRAFCGDDTGRICFTPDGSEPPVVGGHCGEPCQEVK